MQCKEIMDVIEEVYPKEAALGFDNVGLQAGRSDQEVARIYLALDATEEVIRAAKEREIMRKEVILGSIIWPVS